MLLNFTVYWGLVCVGVTIMAMNGVTEKPACGGMTSLSVPSLSVTLSVPVIWV